MRPSIEVWGLRLAEVVATRGTCLRRQVGCVLLDVKGRVLSTGYNGRASGLPHCDQVTGFNFVYGNGIDESKPLTGQATGKNDLYGHACAAVGAASGTLLDGCEALHAEQNALLQCRDVDRVHLCCVTTAPCVTCTKLLLNTSCQQIIIGGPYAASGEALWVQAGRRWSLIPSEVKPRAVPE